MRSATCQGCGEEFVPPGTRGRTPKWCSGRCRKNTMYGGECADCGRPTSYSYGTSAAERCRSCAREASRYWTDDQIVAAFQAFAHEHGRTPRVSDFSPAHARRDGRASHTPAGRWPRQSTVYAQFGSWNAAVLAAGLEPFDHARDHTWAVGRPFHTQEKVA